jgi:acid phosphatase
MNRIVRVVLAVSLASSLASCSARTAPSSGSPRPPGTATSPVTGAASAPLRHTHENLNAVLWMQQSMEYQIASEGLYAHALHMLRAGIEKSRSDPSWSAAVEQRGGDYSALPPAVVMDLDETVLDNSPAQARGVVADEAEFDVKAWGEWVEKRSAGGVPGAIHFVQQARKVANVFFVTNRTAAEEPATLENLAALGLPTDPSDVLTLGETAPDGTRWVSDKTARRALLASTHRILLLVGDDLGDFISVAGRNLDARRAAAREFSAYWADRWVALPNPTYGSWERATFDRTRPDAGRLDQKRKLLKTF